MAWMLAALALIGAVTLIVACPWGGKSAVPTEVEIEWPDAGVVDQSGETPRPN